MRVKILSGNQTGQVVDLPQAEAENALSTGFAERVEPPATAAPAQPAARVTPPAPTPPKAGKKPKPR